MDDVAGGANITWQRITFWYTQFNCATAITTELHGRSLEKKLRAIADREASL